MILGTAFEKQERLLPGKKNRGRWKRSVPVVTKGIICVLSQSPNGSKSGRGEHRRQAIGKRRQAVGKRWLRRAESASVGDLQPQGCLHFNRCNDLCTELFLFHHQITCIRDDLLHQCDDSSSHHSLLEARACLFLAVPVYIFKQRIDSF